MIADPQHFKIVIQDEKWVRAMNEKLQALEDNYTRKLTNLSHVKKAIGCKWLYKTKYNSDGPIEIKKARLVVLGNKQRKGIDYEETFAQVAKMINVRSLLAVAHLRDGSCIRWMSRTHFFMENY